MLYQRPKSKFTSSNVSGLLSTCLINFLLGMSTVEAMNWFLEKRKQEYFKIEEIKFMWPCSIFFFLLGSNAIYTQIEKMCTCCFPGLRKILCLVFFIDVIFVHFGLFIMTDQHGQLEILGKTLINKKHEKQYEKLLDIKWSPKTQ